MLVACAADSSDPHPLFVYLRSLCVQVLVLGDDRNRHGGGRVEQCGISLEDREAMGGGVCLYSCVMWTWACHVQGLGVVVVVGANPYVCMHAWGICCCRG